VISNLWRIPMKHPARSDFDTLVTEAGVRVTFTPTNSIYVFYRLSDPKNIEHVGPVSFVGVKHARRNTGTYPSKEVQDMAGRIASEFARCFRSALDDALAGTGSKTTNNNITRIKTLSLASIPRHVASEVAATVQLIQSVDKADLGSAPKNPKARPALATLASLSPATKSIKAP
jgi:hypothetical protein